MRQVRQLEWLPRDTRMGRFRHADRFLQTPLFVLIITIFGIIVMASPQLAYADVESSGYGVTSLYVQWVERSVTYESNPQFGQPASYTVTGEDYRDGDIVAVLSPSDMQPMPFTHLSFEFKGWNTEPNGSGTWYAPDGDGDGSSAESPLGELTLNENKTLYAIWQLIPLTGLLMPAFAALLLILIALAGIITIIRKRASSTSTSDKKEYTIKKSSRSQFTSATCALTLVLAAIVPGASFADGDESVDMPKNNTRLFLTSPDGEYSGWGVDPANPDEDGDGVGDNLAFTVPTQILFTVRADGTLIGPNNATIENHSVFPIHVSSIRIAVDEHWTLIDDATGEGLSDSFDMNVSVEGGEPQNLLGYASSTEVAVMDVAPSTQAMWNMAKTDGTSGSGEDSLSVVFSGHVSDDVGDWSQQKYLADIYWYMTRGNVSNE